MRFLADENIPGAGVAALRKLGHDVVWVGQIASGASDASVLARAAREGRIILTFDKDFGELARNADLPLSCGVILFRLSPAGSASRSIELLVQSATAREDWPGHFSVIEPGRVRMRKLR
jgi:predicted nuclease of predicted toxin-antitoxin system